MRLYSIKSVHAFEKLDTLIQKLSLESIYTPTSPETSEKSILEKSKGVSDAIENLILEVSDKSNDASDKLYADEQTFSIETFYNLIFLEPTRKLHSQVENVDDGTSDTFKGYML